MIEIKQGETYIKRLEFKYADTMSPVDLTGYTAHSEMRNVPGGDLLATGTCGIDAENGIVLVTYSSAKTSRISPQDCGFDVWIVSGSEKHPVYTSRVKILKRYTDEI